MDKRLIDSAAKTEDSAWPDFFRLAGESFAAADSYFRKILDALPVAVYVVDRGGAITYYNEAAAALWGQRPEIGKTLWCGSWKLYLPDGQPLAPEGCPTALAVRDSRSIASGHLIMERPDGTQVLRKSCPTVLRHPSGDVFGAVTMLTDVSDQLRADEHEQRLAAIVESSDDAIIGKDLNGVITSWNLGAARLFGYTADEVIGKSITILIPEGRQDEEPAILARLRRGERIDHYETIRQRKDGSLVDISLTVSPIKNADGRIIGASKISRSIADRRRAEDQQQMLIREMDHRVKNLFALTSSVVSLSARSAKTPQELAARVSDRLAALARAHALTLPASPASASPEGQSPSLHALIETIAAPYDGPMSDGRARVVISGADLAIRRGPVMTSFALLLHEFFTNAAKYGALSMPQGHVDIECIDEGELFILAWSEYGGPEVKRSDNKGFGTILGDATVKRQLGGEIVREWHPEGLKIRLSLAQSQLVG